MFFDECCTRRAPPSPDGEAPRLASSARPLTTAESERERTPNHPLQQHPVDPVDIPLVSLGDSSLLPASQKSTILAGILPTNGKADKPQGDDIQPSILHDTESVVGKSNDTDTHRSAINASLGVKSNDTIQPIGLASEGLFPDSASGTKKTHRSKRKLNLMNFIRSKLSNTTAGKRKIDVDAAQRKIDVDDANARLALHLGLNKKQTDEIQLRSAAVLQARRRGRASQRPWEAEDEMISSSHDLRTVRSRSQSLPSDSNLKESFEDLRATAHGTRTHSATPTMPSAPTIVAQRLASITDSSMDLGDSDWRASMQSKDRGTALRKLSQSSTIPVAARESRPQAVGLPPTKKWLSSQGLRGNPSIRGSSEEFGDSDSVNLLSQNRTPSQEFGGVDGLIESTDMIHVLQMSSPSRLSRATNNSVRSLQSLANRRRTRRHGAMQNIHDGRTAKLPDPSNDSLSWYGGADAFLTAQDAPNHEIAEDAHLPNALQEASNLSVVDEADSFSRIIKNSVHRESLENLFGSLEPAEVDARLKERAERSRAQASRNSSTRVPSKSQEEIGKNDMIVRYMRLPNPSKLAPFGTGRYDGVDPARMSTRLDSEVHESPRPSSSIEHPEDPLKGNAAFGPGSCDNNGSASNRANFHSEVHESSILDPFADHDDGPHKEFAASRTGGHDGPASTRKPTRLHSEIDESSIPTPRIGHGYHLLNISGRMNLSQGTLSIDNKTPQSAGGVSPMDQTSRATQHMWQNIIQKYGDDAAQKMGESMKIPESRRRRTSMGLSLRNLSLSRLTSRSNSAKSRTSELSPAKAEEGDESEVLDKPETVAARERNRDMIRHREMRQKEKILLWEQELANIEHDAKEKSRGIVPRSRSNLGGLAAGKLPESWSRFPSHTRSERTESAGPGDLIESQDFVENAECEEHQVRHDSDNKVHKTGLTRRVRGVFDQLRTTSTTSVSDRLHGRKSSIHVGGRVEYPELELVGSGAPRDGELEQQIGEIVRGAEREKRRIAVVTGDGAKDEANVDAATKDVPKDEDDVDASTEDVPKDEDDVDASTEDGPKDEDGAGDAASGP
ncbi:hypothetical protein PVAG01_01233 [Phlyctema vagabunda]|uniref:Uncharacterized protein n=1 Tax=Phlyctema vagabunda TaxID=108571 RepID=A0ABR4PWK0_9HELO